MVNSETASIPRNRSLKFEDHEALLHRYARKFYGRLVSQVSEACYEDVMGELSIAFVKASRGYDVNSEFTFTAYLTRSLITHFNKYAKRLILEQYGSVDYTYSVNGLRCISIHELGAQDGDLDDDPWSFLADSNSVDASYYSEMIRDWRDMMHDNTLSPETRMYIGRLAFPEAPLRQHHLDMIKAAKSKIRKEVSSRYGVTNLGFLEYRDPKPKPTTNTDTALTLDGPSHIDE